MKAKQVLIASLFLLILHGLTMMSSCGSMKKHKTETNEEHSSQTAQSDKEAQTIVETWKEIQKEWLHELEFNSASITRDTLILSNLTAKKTGTKHIRAQAHEESKHMEQTFQEQNKEEKSTVRSNKEREPPRLLLWIGIMLLITIGLAWYLIKT